MDCPVPDMRSTIPDGHRQKATECPERKQIDRLKNQKKAVSRLSEILMIRFEIRTGSEIHRHAEGAIPEGNLGPS